MDIPQHIDAIEYLNAMEEIKLRVRVLDDALHSGLIQNIGLVPNVELAALQLRKIYELFAFAVIAVNRKEYEANWVSFKKDWNLAKILKRIGRLDPGCFPKSVNIQGEKSHFIFEDNTKAQISKDDLSENHGKLGEILHASNPYSERPNFEVLGGRISQERNRLVECLRQHIIAIPPNETLYFVELMPEGEKPRITSLYQERGSDV